MAKKQSALIETFTNESEIDMTNDETINETTSSVISYKSFQVDSNTLDSRIVRRLMEYGFAKRLQDSVSGLKKELTTKGELSADEVDQAVLAAQTEAFDDIVSGAWGTPKAKAPSAPRAPKAETIDGVMHKVASEIVRAKIKGTEHAKTLKGDALQQVIANYVAKHNESVRAEAERRMGAAADTAGLDDLLNF